MFGAPIHPSATAGAHTHITNARLAERSAEPRYSITRADAAAIQCDADHWEANVIAALTRHFSAPRRVRLNAPFLVDATFTHAPVASACPWLEPVYTRESFTCRIVELSANGENLEEALVCADFTTLREVPSLMRRIVADVASEALHPAAQVLLDALQTALQRRSTVLMVHGQHADFLYDALLGAQRGLEDTVVVAVDCRRVRQDADMRRVPFDDPLTQLVDAHTRGCRPSDRVVVYLHEAAVLTDDAAMAAAAGPGPNPAEAQLQRFLDWLLCTHGWRCDRASAAATSHTPTAMAVPAQSTPAQGRAAPPSAFDEVTEPLLLISSDSPLESGLISDERNPQIPFSDREAAAVKAEHTCPGVALVLAFSNASDAPKCLRSTIMNRVMLPPPDAAEVERIVQSTAACFGACTDEMAMSHMLEVVRQHAGHRNRTSIRQLSSVLALAASTEGSKDSDATAVLKERAEAWTRLHAEVKLEEAAVPNVRWEDIGGLARAKQEIMDLVRGTAATAARKLRAGRSNAPVQVRQLHGSRTPGVQRTGLLLFGPPGTGKTLLAKAIATECGMAFISVKGPELLNMYIGESERNIRDVFVRAKATSPCVVFFDELDSLAPARARSADSGAVMDRMVSQLLTELDDLHATAPAREVALADRGAAKDPRVVVVGATNRPDLLDPALLRPGRFDRLIYLGMPAERSTVAGILRALTRKFCLGSDVAMDTVAAACPRNVTGADLQAVCSNAYMSAVQRAIAAAEARVPEVPAAEAPTAPVTVQLCDFLEHAARVRPSVNDAELQHYEALCATYSAIRAS